MSCNKNKCKKPCLKVTKRGDAINTLQQGEPETKTFCPDKPCFTVVQRGEELTDLQDHETHIEEPCHPDPCCHGPTVVEQGTPLADVTIGEPEQIDLCHSDHSCHSNHSCH